MLTEIIDKHWLQYLITELKAFSQTFDSVDKSKSKYPCSFNKHTTFRKYNAKKKLFEGYKTWQASYLLIYLRRYIMDKNTVNVVKFLSNDKHRWIRKPFLWVHVCCYNNRISLHHCLCLILSMLYYSYMF